MQIRVAEHREDITNCFPLMNELRPHLTLDTFLTRIERLRNAGYQLIYLDDSGIKALAGIRIGEWLHTGKYLEIEELVTTEGNRSQGYGGYLFDWIKNYATEMNCNQVRLVSGVKRVDAHRFYENKGMTFEARYFSLTL
ncbi:GNAT family N-acetyltransferase [Cellvibrio mixtus]|uniref:GNAT family N-acetyltransferase n=1 Tax=Cellvibrio mixtus TaxID=39650 RepID=UPI000586CB2C|nr:GNAT family N-acetyltransferase [Cellvibrio mixtus]